MKTTRVFMPRLKFERSPRLVVPRPPFPSVLIVAVGDVRQNEESNEEQSRRERNEEIV